MRLTIGELQQINDLSGDVPVGTPVEIERGDGGSLRVTFVLPGEEAKPEPETAPASEVDPDAPKELWLLKLSRRPRGYAITKDCLSHDSYSYIAALDKADAERAADGYAARAGIDRDSIIPVRVK